MAARRARYRDPSGRERSKHFDRKADAQRWLAQVELSKARGEWMDPASGRIAFLECAKTRVRNTDSYASRVFAFREAFVASQVDAHSRT